MPWTLDDVLKELENQQTTAKTSNAKSGRWTVQDVEEALKPKPPVLSDREQLKSEMSIIRKTPEFKQYKTDIRTMPVTPVAEQTKDIPAGNWYDTLKREGIGKGLLQLGGETLNVGQTALLNLSKNILNLAKGQPLEWKPNYSYAEYAKDVAPQSGLTKTLESGTFGGNLLNLGLEVVSDPLTFVGGGIVDDLSKAGIKYGKLSRAQDITAAGAKGQQALKKLKLPRKLIKQPLTGDAFEFTGPSIKPADLNIPDETIIKTTGDYIPPVVKPRTQYKPLTFNEPGRFTVKNQDLENAQNKLNEAITEIQNYFKTNELRANEIARIKPELGIDIEKLVSDVAAQEGKTSRQVFQEAVERSRLKRAAGLESPRLDELRRKVAAQPGSLRLLKSEPKFKPEEPQKITPELVGGTIDFKNAPKIVEPPKGIKFEVELPKLETKTIEPPKVFNKADTTPLEPGTRERGFSRNIRTDMAMPDEIRQVFDEDPLIYKQISNNETLSKAQAIYNKGTAEATSDFYNSLNSKEFKPETVPLAKMLAKDAVSSGDMATARTVLSDMAVKLTEAGQFSQAAKILREADPETFLYTIDKQLKKLNEQGAKQYGKKWKDIDLLPDEIEAIRKIPQGDQHAYEAVWEQIGNRIAKELPSTGMEKFDAWRRIAMLLNPKTHIRNTLGNVIMAGMQKASDTIGAAFEKAFVPVGQRTKSVGWSLDKNIVSKVDEAWDTVKKDLLGESRWEIDNLKALGMEKRIFKNNILQRLNEASLKSLNLEDNIFTKRAYRDSLGQYMKANKLDTVTDAAQEYAKRRALEATFKQTNELASILNNLKRKKVFGTFVEGAIPFTKTPANIAMRAIEYSPAGLIKALYNKSAGKTAADVIEDLSKGLTGSAISTLGFILASIGWGRSEKGRSEKAEGILSEAGEQPYSIVTPLGSYTFDWAQPFAVPLAMGMAIAESLKRRKDGDAVIEAVWNGIKEGGDTIFNMTMLKNIKDILGGGGSVTQKIASIPISYIEQAIPTLFGQIGRTVDDVKRSTYDPNPIKQELNKIKAKAGFTKGLEPKLNVWGEEQKQGGPLQQLFSPGFAKEKNSDKVTQEMARLFKSIGETKFLPKLEDGKFTDKDIDYRLSAKQLTDFQRDMGQANYRDISAKINTPEYKMASDEQKAKFIKFIVERNYENAKKKALKQLKSGQK